jgi:hypothetical protein
VKVTSHRFVIANITQALCQTLRLDREGKVEDNSRAGNNLPAHSPPGQPLINPWPLSWTRM